MFILMSRRLAWKVYSLSHSMRGRSVAVPADHNHHYMS